MVHQCIGSALYAYNREALDLEDHPHSSRNLEPTSGNRFRLRQLPKRDSALEALESIEYLEQLNDMRISPSCLRTGAPSSGIRKA